MSLSAVIKFAPVYTAERYKNPEWERPGRDFYWRGSLELLPISEVPLLVNHDKGRQVGVVRTLSEIDWTDGKWICAHVSHGPAFVAHHGHTCELRTPQRPCVADGRGRPARDPRVRE